MAKLKNPLLSLKASGSLAKILTFVRRGGVDLVEKKPELIDAHTSTQLAWRHMFNKCVDLWHLLSAAEKQEWESAARSRHMTGYAWYISQCLRPNPGIYLPLQGGTMSGDIDMDSNRVLRLPPPLDQWEAANKRYVDALDRGEGHIVLMPADYDSIVQGTWVFIGGAAFVCGVLQNQTDADGDAFTLKAFLQAGTYTFMFLNSAQHTDRGIVDIDIDAVEVASFDFYSAVPITNARRTQTGIVVATTGLKTITVRVGGKNPLATHFYVAPEIMAFWRTA